MRPAALLLLSVACLPAAAVGQRPQGTNLIVDIQVTSAVLRGDTARVEYLLRNRSGSAEDLFTFTVDAPSRVIRISAPTQGDWDIGTDYRGRSVADWAALGRHIAPGAEAGPLTIEAVGLPGIVTAWVRGYFPPPPLGPADTLPVVAPSDPLLDNSVPGKTVGIEPVPAGATPGSLLARLLRLARDACGLGWISEAAACAALESHLAGQPVRLAELAAALEARGGASRPVSDNAYWLLKVNLEYLLKRLDIAGIRLSYVCGNRFRVHNPNDVALPMRYEVYGQDESGLLSLAPRAAGAPFGETIFTTQARGTVRLFWGTQVIQTAANGGIAC